MLTGRLLELGHSPRTRSAILALSIVFIPSMGWNPFERALISTHSSSSRNRPFSRFLCTASMTTETTCVPPSLKVEQFPCLDDNYGFLIHDAVTGATAAVDTPDAACYQQKLAENGWKLTHIFNTHHHWDHTGGNAQLKNNNVKVYGPESERAKIPGIDVGLKEGDVLEFGTKKVEILDVGGHTTGHIAYYFQDERKIFVGDSLFAMGCGRMFEGSPPQFWESLQKLQSLPDDTMVFCAHEYTLSNAKFAISIEPGNTELVKRFEEVKMMRSRSEPTVPTFIGVEKATNPFLRGDQSEEIRRNVGASQNDSGSEIFAKIRTAKDHFRG